MTRAARVARTSRGILLVALIALGGSAWAQDSPAGDRPAAEAKEAWLAEAEARIEGYRDALETSREALDQRFGDKGPQLFHDRVRELLRDMGARDDEVAAAGYARTEPALAATYRDFYDAADRALSLPLVKMDNATAGADGQAPRPPKGTRAAIERSLAWLEEDLKLFRYLEAMLPQFVADGLEIAARQRAIDTMGRITGYRANAADREFDVDKGAGDAGNVAARRKAATLRANELALGKELRALTERESIWSRRAAMIARFAVFYRYTWMAKNQDRPFVSPTKPLVPLVDAFKRIEAHIGDLGGMLADAKRADPRDHGSRAIANFYLGPLHALYDSLATLQFWTGADPKDLDELDQAIGRFKAEGAVIGPGFAKFAKTEQQLDPIDAQLRALWDQESDLRNQSSKLRRAGDRRAGNERDDAADAVAKAAEPLKELREKLVRAYSEESETFDRALSQIKVVSRIPDRRLVWIQGLLLGALGEDDLKTGGWRRTDRAWVFEVEWSWPINQLAMGIPTVLEVEYDVSLPDDQATIPLEITIGDTKHLLTARVEPDRRRAYTEAFVLAPAGPVVAPPPPRPDGGSGPVAREGGGPRKSPSADESTSSSTSTSDRERSKLVGSWALTYTDGPLGEIKGTATVKQTEQRLSATVVVTDPKSERRHELRSSDIKVEGDQVTIVLEGGSPSSETLEAPAGAFVPTDDSFQYSGPGAIDGKRPTAANAKRIEVPSTADRLVIVADDFQGEIALGPRNPADVDRIRLQLTHEQPDRGGYVTGRTEERLVGFWSFDADPLTRRDGTGRGRVGRFVRDRDNPDATGQVGEETWVRTIPPVKIQLFALAVGDSKRIDRLYGGVPTMVEAVFDEPQEKPEREIQILVADRLVLKLRAQRDPDDARRFISEPFVPSIPEAASTPEPPTSDPRPDFPFSLPEDPR